MPCSGLQFICCLALGSATALGLLPAGAAPVQVISTNHVAVRMMAANLTDDSQSYEDYAIRIFQGLKPDVVAIQEFNYLGNGSNDLRSFVTTAFGTNYTWFRESVAGYSIPNGVISRWPIAEAGSWDDLEIPNRGFAWTRIDLPGPEDLYVVSIHLKASSSASDALRRANEAAQLKSLVQSNFPAGALVIVAGDCNIQSPDEAALATLQSFLVDSPVPTDAVAGGRAETNNGRTERYDYIFPSPSLSAHRVAATLGTTSYPNGLVFDSRLFTAFTIIPPIQTPDSGLAQHMAVVKEFRIPYAVTNVVDAPPPVLQLLRTNVLRWAGVSNVPYTVQRSAGLPPSWTNTGVAISPTTNVLFTNSLPGTSAFYRVLVPSGNP